MEGINLIKNKKAETWVFSPLSCRRSCCWRSRWWWSWWPPLCWSTGGCISTHPTWCHLPLICGWNCCWWLIGADQLCSQPWQVHERGTASQVNPWHEHSCSSGGAVSSPAGVLDVQMVPDRACISHHPTMSAWFWFSQHTTHLCR